MTLKDILAGTSSWLRAHRYEAMRRCEPVLNDEGLLASRFDASDDYSDTRSAGAAVDPVVVTSVTSMERREPGEKLEEGFNKLVDQLDRINGHLNRQLEQHEELMGRVRELPQVLETLPSAIENQKKLTSQLLDQLRTSTTKNQQFIEAVGQIPAETARQTDTLTMMNHQLAAAAETDVQLADSFVKFKGTLDRLNHNTISNTEGIMQMSRTFAASDRYLKYVVAKMNRRYAWILALALSVCAGVISALVGIIFYLAG
jgi:methyl-accepting chemotaxis protein